MKQHWITFLATSVVYAFIFSPAEAANILTIFPLMARSHWFAFKPLFEELSDRGHNVTVVLAATETEFHPAWEVLTVPIKYPPQFPPDRNTIKAMSQIKWLKLYDLLVDLGVWSCDVLFEEEAVQKLINTQEKKFDVLMTEYFNHNCFLAFAHKFGCPVIGLSSFGGFVWTMDAVGDPYPASYVPDVLLDYEDHMTFFQRLWNACTVLYTRYLHNYHFIPKADEIVRKHFKNPAMPSISEIESNTSLLIVQSHISFSYPRPHLPNVIETGGMHIKQPKSLPKDLQTLLDNAKDGVIYFSLGSFAKSSDLPEGTIEAFRNVFSRLKHLVLWKWDKDNMENQPPNVKLSTWFPQTDILAHKNIRLFISHGGLQSTLEATSRGVPLVGMPLGAEQRYNVRKAAKQGYCVRLDMDNVTVQSVEWAVSEILNNPAYREAAKSRSQLFWDRPQSGLDTAVYWTEYVLRHKGAPHLRSAALDLTWYQHLLLDVIGAVVLAVAVVVFIVGVLIRKVFLLVTGKSSALHKQVKVKTAKKDR